MEPTKIPRRIDEPPHLLLWSTDELAPALIGLLIGIFAGSPMTCLGVGLVVTSFYRRYKDNRPDGYLLHLCYWYGFNFGRAKSMVNPYVKRFIP